jgi:putative ABC transport system substrate-binding protein
MDRRAFVIFVAGTCMLEPCAVPAQESSKIVRIGVLRPEAAPTPTARAQTEALLAGLRELGWVEGKDLAIETRFAGVNPERQRELAAELKALPVALIVAAGTITIRAARDGAPGVPVVMVYAGDAVGAGLVASLARPGGDLTGTSAAGEEVLAKQLELLSAAAPQLKKVGVLMNRANPANDFFFGAMLARAKILKLQLDRIEITSEEELDGAITRAKGGALVVVGDPMFYRYRDRITWLALRLRVPSIYGGRDYLVAGGLMSYLSPNAWHWNRAARFVDKILKGAKPADLPVQQPTKFEFIINLKTANELGVQIPIGLLGRADDIIR